jgi:FkbM family methyltransferase
MARERALRGRVLGASYRTSKKVMIMRQQHNLIFDIGLHKGFDTEFYANKGFQVVGIEAVPALAQIARMRLQRFINSGTVTIVEKAIHHEGGQMIPFFINPVKDDWGSTIRGKAEKGLVAAQEISAPTTTIRELYERFGIPYYVKCDIEGGDQIVLQQLAFERGHLPTFLSVEANDPDDINLLETLGYDAIQIVNQWMHAFVVCPNPAREGVYVETTFNGEMSGLFGRELPLDRWLTFDQARARFSLWWKLRFIDETLAPGWIDFHVCKRTALISGA